MACSSGFGGPRLLRGRMIVLGKQPRSGLIRLSAAAERLLVGVKGRLMRKHKDRAGLLSMFLCVGSAEVRESESLQPHKPTHS